MKFPFYKKSTQSMKCPIFEKTCLEMSIYEMSSYEKTQFSSLTPVYNWVGNFEIFLMSGALTNSLLVVFTETCPILIICP